MEWLAMGGYAGFVWGSYGVVLVAIVAEIILLGRRRRRALVAARAQVGMNDAA